MEKQNTTAFAYIFQRWVYVDDAETEFPIDKFSTTVTETKSI
jgi:hypothetical protein